MRVFAKNKVSVNLLTNPHEKR